MPQDALELPFRELRDQILNANREIEELKKQLNRIVMEKEDLLKEKNNLQEQVDYLKKKLFGTSSEKCSGELEGQLRFLINEAEVHCDIVESLPAEEEPEEDLICDTSENAYKRKMSGGKIRSLFLPGTGDLPFTFMKAIIFLKKIRQLVYFFCKRQIIVESEAFFEKQKKINEKSK